MGGSQPDADALAHFGVKGMKWGKHKAAVRAAQSPDHIRTNEIRKKVKSTKVSSLTNSEMQAAIARMNLEKQWNTLNPKTGPITKGRNFVKGVLGVGKTVNDVINFQKSPTGRLLREGIFAAANAAANSSGTHHRAPTVRALTR